VFKKSAASAEGRPVRRRAALSAASKPPRKITSAPREPQIQVARNPHLRSHFLANQIITPWQFSIQIQKLPKSSRTTTYASGVVEFAHALRTELIAEVAEVDLSNKMPYGEGAGIIRMQGQKAS